MPLGAGYTLTRQSATSQRSGSAYCCARFTTSINAEFYRLGTRQNVGVHGAQEQKWQRNEITTNERNNVGKSKFEDHPAAGLFPMMDREDKQRLRDSVMLNGQLVRIVLHEGKILDGRNTEDVCYELDLEPRYVNWSDLPKEERGASPLDYVFAHNHARRHLKPSQLAAIAAEAMTLFEEQLKREQKTTNGDKARDPLSQETEFNEADENQDRKRGRPATGRATERAGSALGVSARQVQRAKTLKEKDPKSFEEVKKGKKTLGRAERTKDKAKAAEEKRNAALKRIAEVCGKPMVDAIKDGKVLKTPAELLEYAKLSDADMLKTKGLINHGWKLAKARRYKQTALTIKNSVGDLLTRAIQQGAAVKGAFTAQFKLDDVVMDVTVKKAG